jgi:hypothetical protein
VAHDFPPNFPKIPQLRDDVTALGRVQERRSSW